MNLIFYIAKCDISLKNIVSKNMKNHSNRNDKTALMFSIAISFLLFAGSGFKQ